MIGYCLEFPNFKKHEYEDWLTDNLPKSHWYAFNNPLVYNQRSVWFSSYKYGLLFAFTHELIPKRAEPLFFFLLLQISFFIGCILCLHMMYGLARVGYTLLSMIDDSFEVIPSYDMYVGSCDWVLILGKWLEDLSGEK